MRMMVGADRCRRFGVSASFCHGDKRLGLAMLFAMEEHNPKLAMDAMESLWTVREVAGYLKASTSYVYKTAERGELPCRRLGALLRFVPSEVRGWAVGLRTGPHHARGTSWRK